mgnify:CR=1 FL=1
MSEEKSMQELFDQARAESKLNDPRINVKIENLRRAGDLDYIDSCISAKKNTTGKTSPKTCVTPFGEFRTKNDFKDALGFTRDGAIKSKPHLYYFKHLGPGTPTYEWVYYTPVGSHATHVGLRELYDKLDIDHLFQRKRRSNAPINMVTFFISLIKKDPITFYRKWEPKREWLL